MRLIGLHFFVESTLPSLCDFNLFRKSAEYPIYKELSESFRI